MKTFYRHELKHPINIIDSEELKQRLLLVTALDSFADEKGGYTVKSLYFDTLNNIALQEKLDGVQHRSKFRIRYYNNNTSFMRLEKKCKNNHLCHKENANITKEQCQSILNGDWDWLKDTDHPLLLELYIKMSTQLLRPKSIVIYRREAFVHPVGNVRITIDSNLRRGSFVHDFLEPNTAAYPLPVGRVLEVKYDSFLPSYLHDLVRIKNRQASSFSKYAFSRLY
ncbi:polyphosphate polymerase domain-containing protein [Clostridium aminobutyricum]|uniref:polyphosphate polymerase domain-containing protein n=1 Tax=Clostridium aminobutyricum TaxID=33953 RepID=UPI0031451052